jgi:hypothetical protein
MNEDKSHGCSPQWFLWGVVLAGISSVPFIILLFNVLRGMSQQKATGLGAVAGGWTEAYATFGFILTFVLPVAAIVLLSRSLSGGNLTRRVCSVLSIVWSGFMLLVYAVGGWFVFLQFPRLVNGLR